MTPYDLSFFVLAGILLVSAIGVVVARNPVHAVLLLVLVFFNAGGLFVLLGAEFLAMLLVIVYIGAVMVLFLFVVMMLNIDTSSLKSGCKSALPVGLFVAGILLAEMASVAIGFHVLPNSAAPANPIPDALSVTNTQALGLILYTNYIYVFQAAGLVLLIAMIGAITLTHRKRSDVRRQSIQDQCERDPKDVLEVHKITPRTGA